MQIKVTSGFIDLQHFFSESELTFAQQVERKLIDKYDGDQWVAFDFSQAPDTLFTGRYSFKDRILIKSSEKGESSFVGPFDLDYFLNLADLSIHLVKESRDK